MLGDINVTHKPIDLARPDANKNHVGCLPIEREQLDLFEESGFVDSWRVLHPEEQSYTWWDVITRSRERNVGWRIDAAWMTKELFKKVASVEHLNDQMGSDHCPIKVSIK
jgi:exodeoxyribonuclease-3